MKTSTRLLTFGLLPPSAGLLLIIVLAVGCGCKKFPTAVTPLSGARTRSISEPQNPLSAGSQYPGEELWIIARGSVEPGDTNIDVPESGTLSANVENQQIPMPLKHTDVRASISGYISEVEVRQQFENPYDRKIEAVYVFPLPHNAAVNGFVMEIGDRRIRGVIREREEAEKIYQEAKGQGLVASLLTEERPNIFTQSVANIEPGGEINVDIKYFHTLEYVDGWYEFVFPMVVGPRYNPAGFTNGIGAVARAQAGRSGQNNEVQYFPTGERAGHDISLRVDIDAGTAIEQFECPTHQITASASDPNHLAATLDANDALPNKDFVLRYRIAGNKTKSSFLTHRDERGGYFSLVVYPPAELAQLTRQPLELVFVLDCSGSMSGRPITQAKAAVSRALALLGPDDSFQIISFSSKASQLGAQPLGATPANIQRGQTYLRSLAGEGGTEMIEGIKAALDFPHDPKRLRFVCFLTDGFIGDDSEILGEIHKRLGESRIFSFGIGSSVNRYLIAEMGQAGRGAVAYLGLHESASNVMEDFFERISHPAFTDLKVDWGALHVADVYPRRAPDLFVGRPVVFTGKFTGTNLAGIRLNGTAGAAPVQVVVSAADTNASPASACIPSLWARMKIASLEDEATHSNAPELPDQIKQVALEYGLVSPLTAFLAVDTSRVTEGNKPVTVPVAVPVPEGVNEKKTVVGE
jgi:Ca-activated chloride channel family protein